MLKSAPSLTSWLWLAVSLLCLLAAWQQPDRRALFLALAVMFSIVAAGQP